MKKTRILFVFFTFAVLSFSAYSQPKSYFNPDQIDIPFQKFTLDNGLTLIVHEDHKAPIVAVNIWYHVGSKNEKQGKTGFAHLFEHLMFNGSQHYNTDYFKALESFGGTDLNGTTDNDRTNYFETIPTAALEQVLFLESDRMGHLVEVIDQAKLDEQRGVVQNEKRQGENQPYGRDDEIITKASYPSGHPYSWTVIGSMDDLSAANLDDVKTWFKTYYGPNNAVLSIAGDITPADALEKVKKYFGDIPPGPTLIKPVINVAKRAEDSRGYYEDRVSETEISMDWNVPQWGSKDATLLDLATRILSNGKTSRLYKKLIYEDQIASQAYSYIYQRELSGNVYIGTLVKPGKSPQEVEQKINTLLQEFIDKGPTQEELDRVRSAYFAEFLKGMERIGGFGGTSDILASNEIHGGSPDFYKTTLKYVSEASIDDIKKVCKEWLSTGKFVLVCNPFPSLKAATTGVDRSSLPALGKPVASSFPELQKATLKNGMNIILAQRKGVPTIVGSLLLNAGFATDILSKPGLANLAMDMIDEGTSSLDALQISDRKQLLGASIYSYSDWDASYLGFNTLSQTFDQTLDLFSDILLNPSFPQKEFDRLKKQHIDDIKRQKTEPFGMAVRVFPKILYGEGHPYSEPLDGSGFESSLEKITLADVKNFYSTWAKPNNATLIVVGDIQMSDLVSKLEARLSGWKKGDMPKINISTNNTVATNKIYLLDRPESTQSVIIGGSLIVPYGKLSEPALTAMNNIFGGDFTSRLNMNLREDKHWAYGAGSFVNDAKGQRPFLAYVSVQTDKTKEAIQEFNKEFAAINGDKPLTADEFNRVQKNMVLKLPGMWETNGSVCNSIETMVKFSLSNDYYKTYDAKVRNLTLPELQQVSKETIVPNRVVWFVVGDKSKIKPGLMELGSEIIELDADGNILK
jgi:predicted Zn-dependent peptidase